MQELRHRDLRMFNQQRVTLFVINPVSFPTLVASEDFEGTEALLRLELSEGWQEPKGERE